MIWNRGSLASSLTLVRRIGIASVLVAVISPREAHLHTSGHDETGPLVRFDEIWMLRRDVRAERLDRRLVLKSHGVPPCHMRRKNLCDTACL
jgi:hypothetical protein